MTTAAPTATAELSTGVRLPYVEHGDPSGIPVVLLHGMSDSLRSFETVLPYLSESVHAYAITQRGHGDADRPQVGYRPQDTAADVAAFMDAVGIERAVVAGSSWGSHTARRFAVEHPDRTQGLVLMASFFDFDAPGVDELGAVIEQLADPVDRAFVREFQESCLARAIDPAYLEAIVDDSCKLPARVWRAVMNGLLEGEVPTALGPIAAPTLVLWGDRDVFCPRAHQDALLAAIPGSRLIAYGGCGHALHWEQPERAAADIAGFAREVAR